MPAPDPLDPLDPLDIADRYMAAQLRVLVDLEWRSRNAAWDLYVAAASNLADAIDAKMEARMLWPKVDARATRIALRCYPDLFAETLLIDILKQVVMVDHPLVRDRVKPGTRMVLGRAWRQWQRDVGLSS